MDRKTPAKLSEELAKLGYTWEYLDKWQPKVDMYWHVDQVNVAGEVVGRAGAMLPNLPGHPDHQARYARRGLLPWPPGEDVRVPGMPRAVRDRAHGPQVHGARRGGA